MKSMTAHLSAIRKTWFFIAKDLVSDRQDETILSAEQNNALFCEALRQFFNPQHLYSTKLNVVKTRLTFLLHAAALTATWRQTPPGDTLDYTTRPEIWPVFMGCETIDNIEERKACSGRKMLGFIYDHFKMPDVGDAYPCCTMVATFIIEKDGSVNDAVIQRELHPLMDAEVLRVINSMPRWTPATTNGRPVRFKMSLPLRIRLE